jgi:hypothetical protein
MKGKEAVKLAEPAPPSKQEVLLTEIRALLKQRRTPVYEKKRPVKPAALVALRFYYPALSILS